MKKTLIFSLLSILVIGSTIFFYQKSQTQILYKSSEQSQAVQELSMRMNSQTCSYLDNGSTLMVSQDDGLAYIVGPEQTLGEAMVQGAYATQEQGYCVRDDPDYPPEKGEVACHCQDKENNCGSHRTNCAKSCNSKLCKCCPGT